MSRNRDPRRILKAKPEGASSRRRARETWEQSLGKRVEQRGKHLREAKKMAANRDNFRKWLEDPTLFGIRENEKEKNRYKYKLK